MDSLKLLSDVKGNFQETHREREGVMMSFLTLDRLETGRIEISQVEKEMSFT